MPLFSHPSTVSPTLNQKLNPESHLLASTLSWKLVEFVSTTLPELGLEIIEVLILSDIDHTTSRTASVRKIPIASTQLPR